MTLIDFIEESMHTDDQRREKESDGLLRFYAMCDEKERAAINIAMTYICGWTLDTCIRESEDNRERILWRL